MQRNVKIRYNTDFPLYSAYPWVFTEVQEDAWYESLAMNINIRCESATSLDILPDGRIKFHISAQPITIILSGNLQDRGYDEVELL